MLGEVSDEHVASGAGHPGRFDVVGVELLGEALEQPANRREGVEDGRVAGRLRAAALDDVTAVLAVDTGGAEELLATRQRVADGVAQRGGLLAGQGVGLLADGDENLLAAPVGPNGWLTLRGELDQERGYSGSCTSM